MWRKSWSLLNKLNDATSKHLILGVPHKPVDLLKLLHNTAFCHSCGFQPWSCKRSQWIVESEKWRRGKVANQKHPTKTRRFRPKKVGFESSKKNIGLGGLTSPVFAPSCQGVEEEGTPKKERQRSHLAIEICAPFDWWWKIQYLEREFLDGTFRALKRSPKMVSK